MHHTCLGETWGKTPRGLGLSQNCIIRTGARKHGTQVTWQAQYLPPSSQTSRLTYVPSNLRFHTNLRALGGVLVGAP
eukprot:5052156-Lingulodinium_polyedra.AAC.1